MINPALIDVGRLPQVSLESRSVVRFKPCVYFLVLPCGEILFVGGVKRVKRCPPMGLFTTSTLAYQALRDARKKNVSTVKILSCPAVDVPSVKAFFEEGSRPEKPAGVQLHIASHGRKFRFVKDEKLDGIEIRGFMCWARGSGRWVYLDGQTFTSDYLKSVGVDPRNGGYLAMRIKPVADSIHNKRCGSAVILEVLDRDLRNLSDMRTKPKWKRMPWLIPSIDAIYRERDRLTKETGVQHHVDHIHPVKHPMVCGLTVPWNLRVVTAAENKAKGNKFNP